MADSDLYAEGLEHQVDLGVVELAAAVRVEYLDARAAPIWGGGPPLATMA